jgi:hypothetical protein
VINVAGHRLGTREIEEAIQNHPAIAEVAVVGVEDKLKGQVPMAFAVVKDAARIATPELVKALEKEVFGTVDSILGAIGRPARVHFVTGLPKTRSGKMLRRSLQALAEGRDPGDLTTIDDPSTHASHMPRAVAAFEAAGMSVLPAPMGYLSVGPLMPLDFVPRAGSLHASARALHEWIGQLWYRLRR